MSSTDTDFYKVGQRVRQEFDAHAKLGDDVSFNSVESASVSTENISISGNIQYPAAPWTPAETLTQLAIWADGSDDATHVKNASSEITQINDKSLHGNNLTTSLGTGNQSGSLTTTTINDIGAVVVTEDIFLTDPSVTINNDHTYFVVARIDSVDSHSDALISGYYDGGGSYQTMANGGSLFKGRTTTSEMQVGGGTKALAELNSSGVGADVFIYTFKLDQANDVADVRYNGLVKDTMTLGIDSQQINNLRLFTNRAQNQFPGGVFCELIIANTVEESDITRIEGYLAHKWGVTLTGTHDYLNAAPLSEVPLTAISPINWPGGSSTQSNDTTTIVQNNSASWSANDNNSSGGGGGVFVTGVTVSPNTNTVLDLDDTQVAVGGKTPVLSASVDDTDVTFVLQWEGTSEYWTGYPQVSGWDIVKSDTQAIGTNVRRYEGDITLDLSSYSGTDVNIPYTYAGMEGVVTVTIAGAGPEITDVTVTSSPTYQQSHYKDGDTITFDVTFNTTDVASISLNGTGAATGNVTDQSVTMNGNVATITATVDTTVTSLTDLPIKISAKNTFGTEGTEFTSTGSGLVSCLAYPQVTAVSYGAYPNGQTELKQGDQINATFTFDTTNVTNVELAGTDDNNYASQSQTKGVNTGGTKTASTNITIHTTMATNAVQTNSRPIRVRAKGSGHGAYGAYYNSGSSEELFVNNQKPTFSGFTVSYPGTQQAIKSGAGQIATVSGTVSNQGASPGAATYVYTDNNTSQIDIPNVNTYEDKDVTMNASYTGYNISSPNFKLQVTRPENGGTASKTLVVGVRASDPNLQGSVPASRLRSGGTNNTSVQQYNVSMTSTQKLLAFDMDPAPGYGTLANSSWSSNAAGTVWSNVLNVSDTDEKGGVSWTNVSATDTTSTVHTSLDQGAGYTLGGYVNRTIAFAAAQSRLVPLGTHVATASKVTVTETFRGDITLSALTNGASLDDDVNTGVDEYKKFTIVDSGDPNTVDLNGDTIFYLDRTAVAANTQATATITTQETV